MSDNPPNMYDVDNLRRCALAARNIGHQGDRQGFGASVAWFSWVAPELERIADRLAASVGDPETQRIATALGLDASQPTT